MSKEKVRLGFNGKFEEKDVEIAASDPAPWDPSKKGIRPVIPDEIHFIEYKIVRADSFVYF